MCGFSTQVNYYSTAHKWHRKSFTNHFARKQLLRKPPDTTILDTFAMLKRFFKKRVMTTPVLFYACFWVSIFFCRKMLPDAQAPQIIPQVVFFSFHDLHVVAFLTRFTKIYKDFGIHQRLFEETSLKASILPRRSGRSPLQYAAASFPKMSLKGAEGYGYTQTYFARNLLLKTS